MGVRVFDWGKPNWGFNCVTEREIIQNRIRKLFNFSLSYTIETEREIIQNRIRKLFSVALNQHSIVKNNKDVMISVDYQ